ncbi:hypothetical protein [[Eubacterium] cellulosolvens]
MMIEQLSTWFQPTLIVIGATLIIQGITGKYKLIGIVSLAAGFLIGLWAITLSIIGIVKGMLNIPTFIILLICGAGLFSKPIRKIRLAALLGLVSGLTVAYYFNLIIGYGGLTILFLVFLTVALLTYLFFKFAEDIVNIIGGIFSISIISIVMGIVSIIWALIYINF